MPTRPLTRRLRPFSVHFACPMLLAALAVCFAPLCASGQQSASAPASEANADQPIAFSHRLHAGDLQVQCVYCHSGARRSAVAGVPAVGVCTGCHRWVKNKTPEMKKVDEHEQGKQPIFWKRINQLDDYVYFSHKRHVAGGLDCQGCHGPVEKMERVEHIEKLTMGWCVTCHEQRKAPLDCSTCHR